MMIEPSRTIYREGLNFGLINSESGAFPKSLYRILFKVSNLDAKGLAKLAASSAYSKHLIRSAVLEGHVATDLVQSQVQ